MLREILIIFQMQTLQEFAQLPLHESSSHEVSWPDNQRVSKHAYFYFNTDVFQGIYKVFLGIESYPLRQRHLVAFGGVSASACSGEEQLAALPRWTAMLIHFLACSNIRVTLDHLDIPSKIFELYRRCLLLTYIKCCFQTTETTVVCVLMSVCIDTRYFKWFQSIFSTLSNFWRCGIRGVTITGNARWRVCGNLTTRISRFPDSCRSRNSRVFTG